MNENPLEHVSKIHDLVDLYEFMDDDQFSECLEVAVKCLVKPDIPVATAKRAIIQMQAWAFIFRMKGQTYMTIKAGKAGTEENKKKNVYFSVSEQCHELAQSLKYVFKT